MQPQSVRYVIWVPEYDSQHSQMALKFVLLVNKQGQTRLAKYSDQSMTVEERRVLEGEIVRKCLARAERQVSMLC